MEAQDGARVLNEDGPPQNQDLSFLLQSVTSFLSEYGWYAAFTCVGVYMLLQHLRKNRSTDSQSSPVSTSSQDPDSVVRRQAALEVSRRRMQEEQDARAAEFRDRQQRVSVMLHAAAVCLRVLMLLSLTCLAGGGQEKTENRDVGKHEGGKELQGKGTSCTKHRRSHFLQLTETKDRQKAPPQQWYAKVLHFLL
uniref:Selenoprotein S n=1 Tax=Cyprinus carpio carpio TaxID=630221 RepID=A0A9J7WYL8_CYPCA